MVARDAPETADRFLDKLLDRIEAVASMPTLGVRPRDDQLRQRGYLVLVEGEYLSFYKILGRQIRLQRGKCSASHPIWKEIGDPQGKGG